ncbi:MAG TPA: sulfite oxidase-like oxidoreductase [Gaiellales bacterium]|jgi:DMSO/TMAO reductase YedYZ molybdopterin-dependent catalytic subunit
MEVEVALFRSSQDRKAREAGVDESRIPPGQYYTDKWPVLHAGGVPAVDLRTWDFRVFGLVRNEIRLSFDELVALGTQEQASDIHCVTRWTKLDMPWKGVPMRAVLEQAQPLDSARFVIAHAEQGFTANLPIEALKADDAMLAYEADGQPLTPEHGYPLRLLVPSRYFWKSAKWLRGLEVSDVDRPGFWEGYGYHNDADPWKEERYGF